VAVDGTYAPGEGENAEPTWTARTPEEMQQITALVRSAIGFTDTETRRDTLEVVNVRFAHGAPSLDGELKEPGMFDNLDTNRIIEITAALVASLAFVFFVLRPLVGGLIRGPRAAGAAGTVAIGGGGGGGAAALGGPPSATGLPGGDGGEFDEPGIDIAQIQGRVRASSVKKMAEVIEAHPEESVQIIRGWLNNAL
jgi:flagellar M-ring protein FliF